MAKRFADSEKWRKPWFRRLEPRAKLAWIYLIDNCDHAGIWPAAFDLMSGDLGEDIDADQLLAWFGDKIKALSGDKFYLPGFVEFQYGDLNPDNRVHKSVLDRLKKEGACKGLIRPSDRAKDKDKDKDKDKFLGECGRIYAAYPRKEGKAAGLKKLAADIKAGADPVDIKAALANFTAHHRNAGTEPQFIPHFKTWATNWREWLDPEHGKSESFGQPQKSLLEVIKGAVGEQ